VAVTDYCTRPADRVARLPKVGGTKNPDVQRIIALRPDLVMMNDEENRREDAEALQRANLDVWVAGPRNVQEMFNLLWDIMDVFDDASYSERVRVIEKTLDVVTLAMNAHPPLRTFVPIWRDPWMSFNRDTYVHDVLRVFGLANVFAGRERRFPLEAEVGEMEPLPPDSPRVIGRDTRYPRVTLAEVEAQQPELIFLPDEPYSFQEEDAEVFYRLDIPAAHCGNIYLVDGALLTWHGTRLAYTLTELPPIIDEARSRLAGSPDTSEDASA
jgi:ABC-type Fe3+-hydroxamate transport system substrate-binding protein